MQVKGRGNFREKKIRQNLEDHPIWKKLAKRFLVSEGMQLRHSLSQCNCKKKGEFQCQIPYRASRERMEESPSQNVQNTEIPLGKGRLRWRPNLKTTFKEGDSRDMNLQRVSRQTLQLGPSVQHVLNFLQKAQLAKTIVQIGLTFNFFPTHPRAES